MKKTILVLSFILSLTALSFLYVNKVEAGSLPDSWVDGCLVLCVPVRPGPAPQGQPQQGHMTFVGVDTNDCDRPVTDPAPPPRNNPGDPPLCPENSRPVFVPFLND